RDAVTPEKYAFNLRNSPSPDSAGRLCREEKIAPEGEERLESTFGAEEIARSLEEGGIPSRVSLSAGEEKRVMLPIPERAYECVTDDGRRIRAGRHFRLFVGGSQPDIVSVNRMGAAPLEVDIVM
ncbi:MAG: hypothetical protein J6U63_00340, partial [Clostridia bacterium]|nr:hypothetical protein [Clostridia bacterium]